MEELENLPEGYRLPRIPYSREIFGIMKNGAFLCGESFDSDRKKYYLFLNEHRTIFSDLFSLLGYRLDGGDGFFYLSEENKPLGNKKTQGEADRRRFLLIADVLTSFSPDIAAGDFFMKSDLLKHCEAVPELSATLIAYSDKGLSAGLDKFLKDVEADGFLEVNNKTGEIIVTSAINYLLGFIARITTYGEYELKEYESPVSEMPETGSLFE